MGTKAEINEYGVKWSASKSGKIQIACTVEPEKRPGGLRLVNGGRGRVEAKQFEVWAIYTGTHDMYPGTRSFYTAAEAAAYANELWRTR